MKRLSLLVLSFFSILLVLASCSNNRIRTNPESISIQVDSSGRVPSLQDMKMSVIQRVSDLIMQEMSAAF